VVLNSWVSVIVVDLVVALTGEFGSIKVEFSDLVY